MNIPEETVKLIEEDRKNFAVSDTFKIEGANPALDFLDKEFTIIEAWVQSKINNPVAERGAITVLEIVHKIVRAALEKYLVS